MTKLKEKIEKAFLEFVDQEYGEVTAREVAQYGAEDKRIRDEKNAWLKSASKTLDLIIEFAEENSYEMCDITVVDLSDLKSLKEQMK